MCLTSASLFRFGGWFPADSIRINLDLVMIPNDSDFTKQAGNITCKHKRGQQWNKQT